MVLTRSVCHRDDYRIVLADPPWQYECMERQGQRTRVADNHYATMALDDIKALPVADVCAEDALLLCWVTLPMLREGLEVIREWGFTYRTAFLVWGKLNADRSPAVGFGKYTRSNGELCLLGPARSGSAGRYPGSPYPICCSHSAGPTRRSPGANTRSSTRYSAGTCRGPSCSPVDGCRVGMFGDLRRRRTSPR